MGQDEDQDQDEDELVGLGSHGHLRDVVLR